MKIVSRGLDWICLERGLWAANLNGQEWRLERRRREAGTPAGWWLFGPNDSTGAWLASWRDEAIAAATREVLQQA